MKINSHIPLTHDIVGIGEVKGFSQHTKTNQDN